MTQAIVLSLIVQLFVIASPFYMQIAVDDAIAKGDDGLLVGLAIGFGLFTLINVAATGLRSLVALKLGTVITFQMVVGLFHHLMRLPLPWFERRYIGDLISRFTATQPIKEAARLIEKMIDFRMLDLYLERLGDIALTEREPGLDRPSRLPRPLTGAIEVRDVSFRYTETEPYVLENASLRVEPGEFVAITGPSGGRKTTVMKVMLGLFEPVSGEVLIDGYPMGALGVAAVREQFGVVMQEDQLLTGSIRDNVAFFDSTIDPVWVERCAEAAGIHQDIMRMPMGYNTLVGDMGGALSGGQRQRILLARALYRRPRVLFLDEGTSHLGPALEQQVNAEIAKLAITRIIIAHCPQTAAAADRILVLNRGRLTEAVKRNAVLTLGSQQPPMLSQVSPS